MSMSSIQHFSNLKNNKLYYTVKNIFRGNHSYYLSLASRNKKLDKLMEESVVFANQYNSQIFTKEQQNEQCFAIWMKRIWQKL